VTTMKPNLKSNEVDMKLVIEEFTTKANSVLTGHPKTIKFFNIEYDCDGSDRLIDKPEIVEVTVDNDFFDEDWREYGLVNELSNATGWCVCSFDFLLKEPESKLYDVKDYTQLNKIKGGEV
jgi:hypothetical protein